jgi:hypothetical protein
MTALPAPMMSRILLSSEALRLPARHIPDLQLHLFSSFERPLINFFRHATARAFATAKQWNTMVSPEDLHNLYSVKTLNEDANAGNFWQLTAAF